MKQNLKDYYNFLGILLVIYFSFLTGKSIYGNWKSNQEAKKIKTEIELLEVENKNLKDLIAYYQTESFKEKEARRKLGLVKPDEKVVIISKEPPAQESQISKPKEEDLMPEKPNWQLWWDFFFKNS